jgi:hypothetical protein
MHSPILAGAFFEPTPPSFSLERLEESAPDREQLSGTIASAKAATMQARVAIRFFFTLLPSFALDRPTYC